MNPIVQKWRENMAKPVEHDAGFEAFLQQERQEIDAILAFLNWEDWEKEADEDWQGGRYEVFDSIDDFIASLDEEVAAI